MRYSALIAASAALVSAAPLEKRLEKRALSANDTAVVQLAHYLENLEYSLYSGGYANFTDAQYTAAGFPAGFRDGVGLIAKHEATHRDTLASVLTSNGVTPLPACTYSFPYTDPKSFAALANMITTVGIGAYLGGALELMDNPELLTDAGAIVTVEARHDAFLRAGLKSSPFPSPFDTSLTALWAFNLAHEFVVSCPEDYPSVAPVVQLPMLKVTNVPMIEVPPVPATPAGTVLDFSWDPTKFFVPVASNAPLYIAFINQDNPPVFEQVTKTGTGSGTVAVPKNVTGVAFAALTTFSGGLTELQLSSFGTLAGPAEVVLS